MSATDHTRLIELNGQLTVLSAERDQLEAAWLETSASLES